MAQALGELQGGLGQGRGQGLAVGRGHGAVVAVMHQQHGQAQVLPEPVRLETGQPGPGPRLQRLPDAIAHGTAQAEAGHEALQQMPWRGRAGQQGQAACGQAPGDAVGGRQRPDGMRGDAHPGPLLDRQHLQGPLPLGDVGPGPAAAAVGGPVQHEGRQAGVPAGLGQAQHLPGLAAPAMQQQHARARGAVRAVPQLEAAGLEGKGQALPGRHRGAALQQARGQGRVEQPQGQARGLSGGVALQQVQAEAQALQHAALGIEAIDGGAGLAHGITPERSRGCWRAPHATGPAGAAIHARGRRPARTGPGSGEG